MTSAPPGTTGGGNTDREYRHRLRKILSRQDKGSDQRIQDILQLAADWFGVELGLLVQVDRSGDTYTVDEVSAQCPNITRGLTGDLLSTYCRMVVVEEEPLALENAPEQGWKDDPAYQSSLLATYIGTEVLVDQEPYGTVCFVDLKPRDVAFDEQDRTFLELISNAVGRVLDQRPSAPAASPDTPQNLSRVERRYRTALKNSPVLFAKVDTDLRYEWVYNPHPDFDPDAVVGRRDDELDDGPGIDRLVDLKRRTLEQGEQIREEITFERSDGLYVYDITATPLREGPGDDVTGLVTASLDITERKETERKYRETQTRYRALSENFPDGAVGVYDSDLRYTLVEGTLVGEALPSQDAFVGARVPDLFPEETARDIVPLFRAAVDEGVTDSTETQYGGRDWKVWATPLRDRNGTVYGGLSFAQDITEQKREARKRTQVISRVTDAIVEVDADWRFTLVNDAAEALYDMEEADLLGEHFWDVFDTALDTRFEETYRRVMETREPDSLVEHFPRLDGWFDVEVYPNEDGGLAFYFQDVTEQKEREAALRRQRNLLAQTQRLAGAWEVDLRSREISWSEEVYRIHGLPPDADIDLGRALSFFPPEARSRIESALDRCVEDGEPYELEVPLVTADEEKRWVRTVGAPAETEDGEVIRVAGAFQDITDRKETEQDLREREARIRGLTNSVPGVVFQAYARPGPEYGFYHVSEHAEDLLGISRDPADFFERCMRRVPEAERERLMNVINEAVEAKAPLEFEAPFVTPSGETIWLLGAATPEPHDRELIYNGVILDVTQRKRAQNALEERETRLRGLANSIPGVVYQFVVADDGTSRYRFVSEHTEAMLGISSVPVSFHERFLEHVPDSHRADARAATEQAIQDETPLRIELPFDRPDGTRIWLLCTSTPVRENGHLVFDGVMLDITDRKEIEHQLREERDRFATLFHNLPTPVVHGEPDEEGRLRTRSVNAAFESVFGIAAEDIQGEDIQDLIVPPDEQDSADSIRRCLLAGEPVDREVRRQTTSGRRDFRVQVALHEGESGPDEGYGIYTDITERKRRERILQERQEKVEALYRATDRLLHADDSCEIAVSITELLNEVFGYLVGVRLVEDDALVPVQGSPELSDHVSPHPSFDIQGPSVVADAFRSGDTIAFDDIRAADDGVDYGDVRAAAIIPIGDHGTISVGALEAGAIDDFDRRLIEVLATYASTSLERIDREEALIEAKEDAEAAARLKSSMMANMSHEIRTPLTSIIGFAEILSERLDGELETFAQKAHRSSNRLMRTLESVLELSRLEAGTFDLNREEVQLAAIASDTMERLRPQAQRKGLSLTIDRPDRPVTGLLNEEALRRILENLLENAIKFTPEGGTVSVHVRTDDADGALVLSVEDTGVGISDEALPEIFEAFKQESEGMDREYEGSGLGLSIVQEITDALGGTLHVETEKGEGSRFIVRLPPGPDADLSSE
jgi:PAS domain S-box-containing protein